MLPNIVFTVDPLFTYVHEATDLEGRTDADICVREATDLEGRTDADI